MIVQGFHIIFSRKEENVPKLFSTKYAIFFIIGSLQGDPNQNPFFQMAVSLKLCNSDPILVKPKCVWEVVGFFNCKQTAKNVNKFLKTEKRKLPPFKRILVLPTYGQKCIVLEVQPFKIMDFDLGHPV